MGGFTRAYFCDDNYGIVRFLHSLELANPLPGVLAIRADVFFHAELLVAVVPTNDGVFGEITSKLVRVLGGDSLDEAADVKGFIRFMYVRPNSASFNSRAIVALAVMISELRQKGAWEIGALSAMLMLTRLAAVFNRTRIAPKRLIYCDATRAINLISVFAFVAFDAAS